MKPKNSFFPGAGASSILMIFVVLCLTVFGVLSYVTANADGKISAKNGESVEAYYSADARVQSRLQQIDSVLLAAKTKVDAMKTDGATRVGGIGIPAPQPNQNYLALARTELASVSGLTVTQAGNGEVQASFSEQVDANRSLSVAVAVNPYGSTERYRITEKKLIGTQTDEIGDGGTLSLWQGSSAQ